MSKAVAWSLVAIQFVLIGLLVAIPRGELYPVGALVIVAAAVLIASGIVIGAIAGVRLGTALTPSPIPRANEALRTEGIYKIVRHPIYTGLFVLAAGLTLVGASVWHVATFIALVALISVKARVEERLLLATYEGYDSYASRVGRFLPGVGRIQKTEKMIG